MAVPIQRLPAASSVMASTNAAGKPSAAVKRFSFSWSQQNKPNSLPIQIRPARSLKMTRATVRCRSPERAVEFFIFQRHHAVLHTAHPEPARVVRTNRKIQPDHLFQGWDEIGELSVPPTQQVATRSAKPHCPRRILAYGTRRGVRPPACRPDGVEDPRPHARQSPTGQADPHVAFAILEPTLHHSTGQPLRFLHARNLAVRVQVPQPFPVIRQPQTTANRQTGSNPAGRDADSRPRMSVGDPFLPLTFPQLALRQHPQRPIGARGDLPHSQVRCAIRRGAVRKRLAVPAREFRFRADPEVAR